MKRIIAIMMCIVCFAGTVMASGMDDETLLVARPRMEVARDEQRDGVVRDRRNIVYVNATENAITIRVDWESELPYEDIIEAWIRNRHYFYMSLAAASAAFLFNARAAKE